MRNSTNAVSDAMAKIAEESGPNLDNQRPVEKPARIDGFLSTRFSVSLPLVLRPLLVTFTVIFSLLLVLGLCFIRLGLSRAVRPSLPDGLSPAELNQLAAAHVLVNENFPDPSFIEFNGTFYAFATRNSSAVNIQVATAPSDNVHNWTFLPDHDALPDAGSWTAKQLRDIAVWAPSVVERVGVPHSTYAPH